MRSARFVGRHQELELLTQLRDGHGAKMVVVTGRLRIGKSRFLEEFSKKFENSYFYSGLPPTEGITPKVQLDEFVNHLEDDFSLKGIEVDDWGKAFRILAQQTRTGKVLVVLDEITWLECGEPKFLPKLKNAWDLEFRKNPDLVLVICGSISAWIEKNILSSTGFLGRSFLNLNIEELTLSDCLEFWDDNDYISKQDKLVMLSLTGGVPRYLELLDTKQTSIQNVSRLCFNRSGALFNEFEHIFSDLFAKKSALYKTIVTSLVSGSSDIKSLAKKLGVVREDVSDYLNDLIAAGFVTKYYSWHFKSNKLSKLNQYYLSDNYCRFYLKYVLPNKDKIYHSGLHLNELSSLPGFRTIIGLQFENLVLKNRKLILKTLSISLSDVVCDNPYFQRKSDKQDACQIDYLIQTKFNALFVCEIKFTTKALKTGVVTEVKDKMKKFKRPKNFSCLPVLIHFGEIQNGIEDSEYFYKIIDFEDYLS